MAINYNSQNMQAIRNARTAAELSRAVAAITTSVSATSRMYSILESTSAKAIALDDFRGSRAVTSFKLPSIVDVGAIDLDAVKSGADQSKKLGALNQSIAELSVAYQIINSSLFSNFKNKDAAAKALNAVLTEALSTQKRIMQAMRPKKDGDVPQEHSGIAATVSQYLKKVLPKEQYTSIKSQTYTTDTNSANSAVFQTFTMIKDFVNTDGVHYSNYNAVFTTVVDTDTGDAKHYITTLVDDQAPGTFPFGSEVPTIARLKSSINNLLAVDGFLNYSDRRPISATTKSLRESTALGLERHKVGDTEMDLVDGIRVQNDKLYVRLVPGLSPKEQDQAVSEVLQIAKTALGLGMRGKSDPYTVTSKVAKGRQGRTWIEVTSIAKGSGVNKGLLTVSRWNKVGELLNLSDAQMRAVKQGLKG